MTTPETSLMAGRYRLLEKLREGGMGTLFRAEDTLGGGIVAIKTLRSQFSENAEARRRFVREAQIAKKLIHPNLVEVLSVVEKPSPLIVMEFLPGKNLEEELKLRKPLPLADATAIALQTLNGLSYLHGKEIVHRDVSPENIMVEHVGALLTVKLIDFGIARDWTEDSASAVFVGKVRYSSPEQLGAISKGTPVDGRSDLYALGCVLYLMVTGEPAVVADTPVGYIMAHVQEGARPFEETDPSGRVPEALRAVILKAMARNREERYQTAAAFADALKRAVPEAESKAQKPADVEATLVLEGSAPPRAPAETGSLTSPGREGFNPRRSGTIGIAAAGLVTSLGLIALFFSRSKPVPTPVRATSTVPTAVAQAAASEKTTGVLVLSSTPWSHVISVEPVGGAAPLLLGNLATPTRLELPTGRYRITLSGGPAGLEKEQVTNVDVAGPVTNLHVTLASESVDPAVEAFLR